MKIKRPLTTLLLCALLTVSAASVMLYSSRNQARASPDWLTDWTYRRQLTIDGTQITAALSNFPILVKLDSADFDFSNAQSNGEDVRFTASDGATLLKYEIENWNSIGEKAEIWVKIPSVAAGSDTIFFMYYGNSGASDAQDPENVWDSNFKMVQHLEEGSGTVTDSTSNNNDGAAYNGTIQGAAGKIDGAADFDGTDDCIGVLHHSSLNLGTGDFTISVWVKYPGTVANDDSDILRKGNTGDTPPNNYKLELSSNKIAGNLYDGSDSRVETTQTYGDDQWHYVVFLRQSTTIYLYVDGSQKASTGSAGKDVSNTATMGIGSKNSYKDDFFDGTIDEVRISNTARSEAWIEASYSSMKNELLTYGTEQTEEPPPPSTADWACLNCRYRIKLTFKNAGSTENLQNFPVLVVLNPSRIDYSKTSATDIRFYDGDTLLPKETELWNPSGTSYIWVKVPQIDNTNEDYIYAYYGCVGTGNNDDAAAVWNGYAMVQHLEETSGTITDSTANDNDGTPNGSPNQDVAGKIDGADNFDGSNDYISIGDAASLDFGTGSFSYMFWLYSRATGTQYLLDKKGGTLGATYAGYKMGISSVASTGYSVALADGSTNIRVDTGPHSSRGGSVWTMFTVVVNRTSLKMLVYIDGAEVKNASISSVGNVDNSQNLILGRQADVLDRYFDGMLDEIQIRNVAWSADWIKACFDSMKDTFTTYGSAEQPNRLVETCTSDGSVKDTFDPTDTVRINGTGYQASTVYALYIVQDIETWSDNMDIPARVAGSETSVTSDADGDILPATAWNSPLTPGKYDIVIDVNGNTKFDIGIDALDDGDTQVTAGFFVIPEYLLGAIMTLAACFAAYGMSKKTRKTF